MSGAIFGHEVFSGMKFFFAYPTKTQACFYLFDKQIKSLYFCSFVVPVVHVFSFQGHTKVTLSLSNACYAD